MESPRGADGTWQARTQQTERVIAWGETHDGVVARHLLPGPHRAKSTMSCSTGRMGSRRPGVLPFLPPKARRQEEPELPERLAAAEPEPSATPTATRFSAASMRMGTRRTTSARDWNGPPLALGDEADGDVLADLRDISQTDADRVAGDGAFHAALVDIGWQDADVMAPGIVGEDVRR